MCGLFAIVPTIVVKETLAIRLRFLFRCLGVANDSRGGHSWGIWSYDYQPQKGLGDFSDDMQTICQFTDDCWTPKKLGWIAGHTRFGTHGAKVVENSHPFTHDGFTLAHNGVVTVDIKDAEVQAHVVDSGQLCIAISKFGIQEAISKTSGSIGLLFEDSQQKLYAYRSDQILHIAELSWGYVISSDKKHLEESLEFAGFFDFQINPLAESMVSAPWYADFTPIEVKSSGRSSYSGKSYNWKDYDTSPLTYGYASKTYPAYTAPSLGLGLVSDAQSKVKYGIVQATKPTKENIKATIDNLEKTLEGANADIDDTEIVPYKSNHGVHGAMHFYQNKHNIVREYNVNGPCDYCGSTLDQDGGFFFDMEVPDCPQEFCSDCLEMFDGEGYINTKKMSGWV